ncbi:MAG: hypothetical protein ACJAQ3_004300 [Planctomycetota bacterium]|jgi:hypothetical protein
MKSLLLPISLALFACGGPDSASSAAGGDSAPAAGANSTVEGHSVPGGSASGLTVTQTTGPDAGKVVAGGEAATGGPQWVTPEGWVEVQPESNMRFKQYSIPAEGDVKAPLVVVAHWPGGIGPVETNLDRWASQVGGPNADLKARDLSDEQRWVTEPTGYLVTHIHVEGTIKPMEGMGSDIVETDAGAILAAFIEVENSAEVWTVKITGAAKIIAANKDKYVKFIAGI